MAKKSTTTTKITGATTARTTAPADKSRVDIATSHPANERSLQGASARQRIDSATRERLIREQAYFNAQSQGFSSDPLLDWLVAEQIVDTKYSKPI